MASTHFHTCTLCEATCGIAVTVEGDRVVDIRGDEDDPFSRGYICPKAAALQDVYYDKDRLKHPVRRTQNGWQRIGWDEAFDEVAQNLKRVLDMTLAEMRTIKSGGATAEELSSAKLHLKGSILLSLESTVSRMSGLARQEYYFGRQFSPDEIIAAIDAVTLEDIAHVAATIVDPDSLSLTLIGNLKSPGISTSMLRQAVA